MITPFFYFSDLANGNLILTGLDLPNDIIVELCESIKSSTDIFELCLKQSLFNDRALKIIFRSLNCDLLHLKLLNLENVRLNNELIDELSALIIENHSIIK